MSLNFINPKAEVLKSIQALAMNINAAMGLQDIMKSNLGPKGTLKMYFQKCLNKVGGWRRSDQANQGRQRSAL